MPTPIKRTQESLESLAVLAKETFSDSLLDSFIRFDELTIEIKSTDVSAVCQTLRDDTRFNFEQLMDVCGVDYLTYQQESSAGARPGPRYAVVYHLLSQKHNRRLRIRAYLDDDFPKVDSVIPIWTSANWFEREAFDLFGIVFEGHPDLRRLLTDYGFIGHPFRKDFPLSGHVEMRYDPVKGRVVYQPVTIDPRILVPRVIREEDFGGRDS